MGNTNSESRRLPSLDGIRAVSILFVLVAHASKTVNFPEILGKALYIFEDGKLGVRVFFVISGFLITSLLLKEANERGRISLSAFYKRRALRILPVYYFYILVIAGVEFFNHHAVPGSTFGAAATFTTGLWGVRDQAETWLLAHTWSLSIEEQFYLTWPALLAFFGTRFPGKIWVPFLMLLAPVSRWLMWDKPEVVGHLFIFQGDSIASGCLLAILLERRKAAMPALFQYHKNIFRIIAIALVIKHWGRYTLTQFGVSLAPSVQCLAISYLIGSLVTVRSGFGFAFLNLAPVQWLGRLSYSLYIWQQLALVPLESVVFMPDSGAARWLIQFPQNLVVVFVLAMTSYYCLELPMLRLKDRFSKVAAGS